MWTREQASATEEKSRLRSGFIEVKMMAKEYIKGKKILTRNVGINNRLVAKFPKLYAFRRVK